MPSLRFPAVVVSLALVLGACAPLPPAVAVYPPGQAMRPQTVELGFVESLREVRIGGYRTGAGGATGALVGGIGGSFVGGSWEANVVGSIVGAILGAFVGGALEEGATSRQGVEVSVRLDTGALVVVVQDAEIDTLKPGDRVRVISDGVVARVTR